MLRTWAAWVTPWGALSSGRWPRTAWREQSRTEGCFKEMGVARALCRGDWPRAGAQLWGEQRADWSTGEPGRVGLAESHSQLEMPSGQGRPPACTCSWKRDPPGCWPEARCPGWGLDLAACPKGMARHPLSDGSQPPRPAAQTVSRVVRKAAALAKPLGAQTPSLATGRQGLPAFSHLFHPPVRPSVCPEVSDCLLITQAYRRPRIQQIWGIRASCLLRPQLAVGPQVPGHL